VAEDHLGLQDIETLDQLARVKAVVPESVFPGGYAILNADNKYTAAMAKNLHCKIAYFSLDENNPIIVEHIKKGGLAAIYESGFVTICKGTWKIRVDKASSIPLTYGGRATFNISNILPCLLAGFIRNFKIEDMKMALETFIPSPVQTPGRMNMFHIKNYTVMVDYAHNTHGFMAISDFLSKVDATQKVGVIAGVGDRRDEDIRNLGRVAAGMFDEIIIRNLSARFGEYRGVKFSLGRSQQRTEEDALVSTLVERPNSPAFTLDWRVAEINGQPKVVDVIAEGTSLRLTTRSEYSAVIQRNNGRVASLLDAMRGQITQLAAREGG
jgi:UDP-N-acetylmuramyl pentapeptide synthase